MRCQDVGAKLGKLSDSWTSRTLNRIYAHQKRHADFKFSMLISPVFGHIRGVEEDFLGLYLDWVDSGGLHDAIQANTSRTDAA